MESYKIPPPKKTARGRKTVKDKNKNEEQEQVENSNKFVSY